MQQLIMNILKSGSTTVEEADKMDALEALLYEQNCFKKSDQGNCSYLGEEIATLFFKEAYAKAIEKLCASGITPEDFFGFVEYHYDDEHEDEVLTQMFTHAFMTRVQEDYQSKCHQ